MRVCSSKTKSLLEQSRGSVLSKVSSHFSEYACWNCLSKCVNIRSKRSLLEHTEKPLLEQSRRPYPQKNWSVSFSRKEHNFSVKTLIPPLSNSLNPLWPFAKRSSKSTVTTVQSSESNRFNWFISIDCEASNGSVWMSWPNRLLYLGFLDSSFPPHETAIAIKSPPVSLAGNNSSSAEPKPTSTQTLVHFTQTGYWSVLRPIIR